MKWYTSLWIDKFTQADVVNYHAKFFKFFEKKYKTQATDTTFIPLLGDKSIWLDFPIGSARLQHELSNKCANCYGMDFS